MNITESSTYDSNVYLIDDADPVKGWDGSTIGISNLQAQALANRTKWLKDNFDIGGMFKSIIPFAPASPGQVRIVTGPETRNVLFRVDLAVNDGALSLPLATTASDGANIFVSAEGGLNVNSSGPGRVCVLSCAGADLILDIESGYSAAAIIVQPFTMVRLFKLSGTLWGLARISAEENAPAGAIISWGGSLQPYGWLECNGSAISRTTFARLFSNIGTTFGVGNGTTTFNIPDLRGEFIRGYDNGRGIDAGRAVGTAQSAAVNSNGVVMRRGASAFATSGSGIGVDQVYQASGPNATYGQTGTDLFGGSETRPRNIALMQLIKY